MKNALGGFLSALNASASTECGCVVRYAVANHTTWRVSVMIAIDQTVRRDSRCHKIATLNKGVFTNKKPHSHTVVKK